MSVGDDKPGEFVTPLFDKGKIRQDNIDTRHGLIRKAYPQINHQPLIIVVKEVGIHADLP
jgi:hypothetical protein